MRILMLRPSYFPEISGGTHLAVDLVEDLIKEGNEIKLIVPMPARMDSEIIEEYKKQKKQKSFDGKLEIIRLKNKFNEKNIFFRALRMLNIALKMFIYIIKEKEIDVIISHSMPVFLGPLAAIGGKIRKIPVIYWEQDIVSESIKSTKIIEKGFKSKLLYLIAYKLEKISSKYSEHIITISKEFKNRQMKLGKKVNDVDIVYNWIDTEQLVPIERDKNYLFDKFNLDRKDFYITYCGNLGLPQNVEIFIDAAKELQHIKDLKFVIFGNGVRRKEIERYLSEADLDNCQLLPLQPLKEASYVYSLGDVGVVIGRKGTSRNGFPSKTWSILAAGQAIISCFDLDSELTTFVKEGNCGIAIEPDSSEKLKEAVLQMYNNREQTKAFGENSRNYVKEKFSRLMATKKFIEVINQVKEEYKGRKSKK